MGVRIRNLVVVGAAIATTFAILAVAVAGGVSDGSGTAEAKRGDGKGGVKLRKLGDFDSPTFVAAAPGFPKLLFVVERDGRIVVLEDGKAAGTFLDIAGLVSTDGERGLLSVAFDPDYKSSRRFYVYYTDQNGDIEVDHFRRSAESPLRADEGSREEIITVRHRDASNHNGGTVAFGPDEKLYLATGDGGGGGDPSENAQDKGSLLGKLLRIDPKPRSKRGYDIPKGNPYRSAPGKAEIYSLGLRNPFRFSFDSRKPLIAIGDVGQDKFEEVDYLRLNEARGANFGWDAFEGRSQFEGGLPDSRHEDPMHVLSHSAGNCSITGGVTVRDRSLKSLRGRYVYADLCDSQVRSFKPRLKGNDSRSDRALGVGISQPVAFGEDAKGNVYVVSLAGGVFRLAPKK